MVKTSPADTHSDVSFFLPHHGMLRPSSSSSKLRVVFNGSAFSLFGVSLNNCLHVGLKLQQDFADVLLSWRRYNFVFLADVEKMYRQIEVHPNDHHFQRILWSRDEPPQEYQLCTVTYGLSCAPYLALRVLSQLAVDDGPQFSLAAPVLQNKMYVDDVLSGAYMLSLAQSKAEQLNNLLMAGGFCLHKWVSNETAVLAKVEDACIESPASRAFLLDALPRVLGLAWNPRADSFVFQLHLPRASNTLTKRVVLSRVAQLFDPLGWIAPTIVVAKIFLQGLWKLQLPWDQPLPASWAQRWLDFEAELNAISSISLSRWLGIHPSTSMEIHEFSDASNALGAVLYLRCTTFEGQTTVSLITGKSKVAPLKRYRASSFLQPCFCLALCLESARLFNLRVRASLD
ncbi:uncharacterized protein LOC105202143 [Solenopsis invicta]|uniref:uncharacterized protein LOC105202143 n=1 Tax=Solenopsis invicta TaxID=13686 RepID=UPI0005961684|nr:uncharacterized protein LOC105202143 [Solenopsis invicta]